MFHRASDRMEYYYGLGGLADAPLVYNVHTINPVAFTTVAQPGQAQTPAQVMTAQAAAEQAAGTPVPCACSVNAGIAAFGGEEQRQAMMTACNTNPTQFADLIRQEAARRGLVVNVAGCGVGANGTAQAVAEPVYKRPIFWAGVGAAAILGVVAWKVF